MTPFLSAYAERPLTSVGGQERSRKGCEEALVPAQVYTVSSQAKERRTMVGSGAFTREGTGVIRSGR